MAEIGFYHLTRSSPEAALPALLGRTLAVGERALVACGSAGQVQALDQALWLATTPDWLPHGTAADGDAALQPIWLAGPGEALLPAANGAQFLFCLEGAGAAEAAGFRRVFDLFDGAAPAAVTAARLRWSAASAAGHVLLYWQQTERGWERKT